MCSNVSFLLIPITTALEKGKEPGGSADSGGLKEEVKPTSRMAVEKEKYKEKFNRSCKQDLRLSK